MTIRILAFFVLAFTFSLINAQNSPIDVFNGIQEKPGYLNAALGIQFLDAVDGDELLAFHPEKLMIPASVLKIVTSATALEILGSEYRFKTCIGYTGKLKNGIVNGDLVVISGGDPTLGSAFFENKLFATEWANRLRKSGITEITGSLILDGSHYETEEVPPTWVWGDIGNYYGANASPFTVYDNLFTITFRSGKSGEKTEIIATEPEIKGLQIDNKVKASDENSDNAYVFGSPMYKNRLIRGTIPKQRASFKIKASVPDPADLLAEDLMKALHFAGIKFSGEKVLTSTMTKDFQELFVNESPILAEIINVLNHESVNLFAEHLLVQLSAEMNGKGSRESGIEIVENFWKEKGFGVQNLVMEDGSGLSHFNAVSPAFLNKVLRYMSQSKNSKIFISSLPSAGEGTLASFDTITLPGNSLKAKSGSMTRVRCYSGYLVCDSGKTVIFTVMVNHSAATHSQLSSDIEQLLISVKKNF